METALVRFGSEFEDSKAPKSGEISTPNRRPTSYKCPLSYMQPTCEEYLSSPELLTADVHESQKLGRIEEEEDNDGRQRGKITAQAPSLSKRSNVTWSDRLPPKQDSQFSMDSQATTAVPNDYNPYQRRKLSTVLEKRPAAETISRGRIPMPYPSTPLVRSHNSRERRSSSLEDVSSEDSSEEASRRTRRAARQEVHEPLSSSLPRDQRGRNPFSFRPGDFGPLHPYTPYPGNQGNDLPYASMQPWPYPHIDPNLRPFPYPRENLYSPWSGATLSGTPAPQAPYPHYDPRLWQHEGYMSLPLPPQLPRSTSSPRPVASTAPKPLSTEAVPDASKQLTDLEFLTLMEDCMELLKQKNEKKLLDANQVLSYLDRRSRQADQNDNVTDREPPTRLESLAKRPFNVPDVFSFQDPDEESDISDEYKVSSVLSHTRNSSSSTSSFLEPRTPKISFSDPVVKEPSSRRTETQLEELSDGDSLSSVCSEPAVDNHASLQSTAPDNLSVTSEQKDNSHTDDEFVDRTSEEQAERGMLEEIIALRRELSASKQKLTHKNDTWLAWTISSSYTRCKKYLRKGPPLGTQRLEWTCECGEDMFADLPIADKVQRQLMLEFLTRSAPASQSPGQDQTTPSQLEGGTAQLNYTSLPQSGQARFSSQNSPASTIGSGSTYVGSNGSQSFTAQQGDAFARAKYIEVCVNVGKYETKLAEIQVMSSQRDGASICTDGHLFRKIYDRYHDLRKQTWRRFLYQPAGIRFVHFGVQEGHRVSFFSDDPLPSEDVLASKRYEYNLQPPVPPPIDSRTFLHYFYKHSVHSQSTSARYVNRLPKKLGESLVRAFVVDELREGWGIHIIEGPNKVAVCWALMVVLVASFGVSLAYDLITKGGDSGFAIGQWMVAALTVALSALYFGLEDEVNSNFD